MGMDVSGIKPVSETGVYFRNNCWWWRPLWHYCHTIAPELVDEETFKSGSYNNGTGLKSNDAAKLGVKLLALIEDGSTKQHEKEHLEYIESLPDENCNVCNNNNRGHKKKEDCFSCKGKGTKDN